MSTVYVNSGGRKQYIDFAKGVVALSVVIGHLVPFNGLTFRWIFGFHMPFFFLLYGYMQKESLPAFDKFVLNKVKRLLIPSWCYRFVYHIVMQALFQHEVPSLKKILFTVFWDPYAEWFLPVMFWVSIGMYVYVHLFKKINNIKLSAILSVFFVSIMTLCRSKFPFHNHPWIPFQLDGGALGLTFAIIGFWLKKYDVLSVCMAAYRTVSAQIARIGIFVGAIGVYTFFSLFNTYENYVNMADNECGNDVVTYFVAAVLMFMILFVSGNLLNESKDNVVQWTCLLGRHSMLIYLGHIMANRVIGQLLIFLANIGLEITFHLSIFSMAFYFGVSMTALTGICLLLEKGSMFRKK